MKWQMAQMPGGTGQVKLTEDEQLHKLAALARMLRSLDLNAGERADAPPREA